MIISPITYADYIPVLKLMKQSHNESRFSHYKWSIDKIIDGLNAAMETPDMYGLFKCVSNDEIIGIYIGFLMNYDFSPELIGIERVFYVRKESRGSKAAYLLKKTFEDWAKDNGAIAEIMVIHHGKNNKPAYQLCEKMGMTEVGKVYERTF